MSVEGMPETVDARESVRQAFRDHAVRRQGDLEMPLGPKARRTRATILAVAAERFNVQGYLGTSMPDVAVAAGVSLGTVYQYFRDRADLVAALLRKSVTSMLGRTDPMWRSQEGYQGLYRVIRNFVGAYVEAGKLSGVWEEVSLIEGELAELRRILGRQFTAAVEYEIRRAGDEGSVRSDVDPAIAARALSAMVDRYCYVTYLFDPPDFGVPTVEQSAEVLTKLWLGALEFRQGAHLPP